MSSVDRLRQLLYKEDNLEKLVYSAIMGKWSKDEYNEANGTLPDVSYRIIFADSPVLSSGVSNEIWPLSGAAMGTPSSAEILDVVSSSTQDDAGGSGVDAVFIEGLDGDYLPQSELVVLDGTTTVNSVNSYVHVHTLNCLNLTTSGTTNAGNITVTNTTSGDTLGYILAGDSISKQSQFVIPAGYNGIMLGGHFSTYRSSGSGARRSEIDLQLTPLDGGLGDRIDYQTLKLGSSSETTDELRFSIPLVVGDKIFIHPTATAEANNTLVSVQYTLILIRQDIDIDTIF
jgi:hypothetical protein